MNIKNKKVLITGAGGFIGSHLTEELVKRGSNVRALVRYNSKNNWGFIDGFSPGVKSEIEVACGDLKDSDAVRKAMKNIDIVFHLGALIAIPYSYANPRDAIETNVMGTFNVLNAAQENNVCKVIHTSTSEVYGTALYVPIDENHPLQGQSPYSASKIGADKIAESFFKSYDLPVTTIRPFNAYGPRQSSRGIIPTVITQALTSKSVKIGATHPTRDFTFVKDTVGGFLKIAESEKTVGEVTNIGSSTEISIGSLTEKIISLIGKDIEIVHDKERLRPEKSEVERLFCDNKKAKELLGWEPAIELDRGLKKTIEWISENIDQYKPEIFNQ